MPFGDLVCHVFISLMVLTQVPIYARSLKLFHNDKSLCEIFEEEISQTFVYEFGSLRIYFRTRVVLCFLKQFRSDLTGFTSMKTNLAM